MFNGFKNSLPVCLSCASKGIVSCPHVYRIMDDCADIEQPYSGFTINGECEDISNRQRLVEDKKNV